MVDKKSKEESGLRTVQRALDILSCFSEERQELTLTDISKEMNLAMSTTTRLLKALEMNHFVEKNQETMKYRLGQRLYLLGYIAGKSIQLRELAKPLMYALRDETKETVNLYVLDSTSRVCIEQAEGLQSIRHLVKIGEKLPLYAGAGGKVLLAFQSEEFQQKVFAAEAYHVMGDDWKKERKHILDTYTSCSIDEREVGSAAVAAPIFNIHGEVKACLSISGPTHRFTEEVIPQLQQKVKEQAQRLSEQLGYVVKHNF
ncbi:IclR family transcriptional regulator [Bacillus safensis]|uniref:IclR family transcriptional regulator n=1 Tax=Bacillus safensis TaxID=561879 RepID=UPI0022809978|nr:IclR family transcriptional regulator [Bacillus safensis]MCY7707752.1 IclR family transcriptional regulator [Bacillus safensis]MCY7726991.1 IclR family transcriptional regulator [Bacillus safensis]MED0881248.1 IclR family transcriptional regulator [Bacillus safensis]MED0916584.1 IclR family transcriptional regulator [Bacillus safensis]